MTYVYAFLGPHPDDPGTSEVQKDTVELFDIEDGPEVKTAAEQLPHRTLVLRRGLALAAMLFILAVGITINLLLTNLIT